MEESDGMKKILLVATGGTIASVEDGRGLAPALSGEELARYGLGKEGWRFCAFGNGVMVYLREKQQLK